LYHKASNFSYTFGLVVTSITFLVFVMSVTSSHTEVQGSYCHMWNSPQIFFYFILFTLLGQEKHWENDLEEGTSPSRFKFYFLNGGG